MIISRVLKIGLLSASLTFALTISASVNKCSRDLVSKTACATDKPEALTWWDKLTQFQFKQFHLFDLIELIKNDKHDYQDYSDNNRNQNL